MLFIPLKDHLNGKPLHFLHDFNLIHSSWYITLLLSFSFYGSFNRHFCSTFYEQDHNERDDVMPWITEQAA